MTQIRGHWVKYNAQAELRENLRTAIKEAGLTQSEAARQAGVKYTHLTGFLTGNNWLTQEALADIAPVLDLSVDELLGASILKHQVDQYQRFNFEPPEWAAKCSSAREALEELASETRAALAEPPENRARALCCVCGQLRLVSTRNVGWRMDYERRYQADRSRGRLTWEYKCENCGEQTRHAILRVDDNRDAAEEFDRAPTREEIARDELAQLVDRLAEFGVDVHYRSYSPKRRRKGYCMGYEFDDAKSRWRIEVDELLPTRAQVLAINELWTKHVAPDVTPEGVTWDHRDGVVFTAIGLWDHVVDDLLADIDRHIGVEQRRMVQRINDEIEVSSGSDVEVDQ